MKTIIISFFALIFSTSALSQSITESDANWILDLEKSDEFNSEEIDKSKWGHQLWFGCSREVAFQDENVSVKDGFLKIEIKNETVEMDKNLSQCANEIYTKTSGAIISKFEIKGDSYIEVKAKLVDYRADLTSAIWISDEPVEEKNPNLEIDIIETLDARKQPKMFSSAMHVWNHYGKYHEKNAHLKLDGKKTKIRPRLSEDFHVFGLERRGDFVRMYIDGKVYWERNMLDFPEFLDQARRLIINVEGHDGKPRRGGYPQELLVDYVRVYNYKK